MARKIFGYVLLFLGIIFILSILVRLPKLFDDVFKLITLFSDDTSSFDMGYTLGTLFGWCLTFGITIICMLFGLKLIKKKKVMTEL